MSEFVKKIRFADGSIKYVYDAGAARIEDLDNYVPKTGDSTINGNLTVNGKLNVEDIEWVQVDTDIDNVLVHSDNGVVSKRSTDKLLEDIGGISYDVDDENGVLSFNIGKNN